MFRCNDVAGFNGLVQVGAEDDLAVVVHAGAGDGGTGQLRDLHLQLRLHGLGQLRAVGDEDRACQFVVLGLTQQVCCHHAGLQPPSASTRISLGPAIISMPTLPNTLRLAVAT